MNTTAINSKVKMIFKMVILFLPVLWGFFLVTKYGVNAFYWDEWEYMRNIDHFFTWDFLWSAHNEHRMFFPNIITYAVGEMSFWNTKILMYVSQIFLIILYMIVVAIIRGDNKLKDITFPKAILAMIVGFCVFNDCQYENLLWGYQIAWYMVVSLGTVSFYCFSRYVKKQKIRYIVLAMASAFVVSFCSMHGLAIWAGYLIIIVLSLIPKNRLPKSSYIIVPASMLVTVFLYFWGLTSKSDSLEMIMYYMKDIINYFLRLVCAPFLSYLKIEESAPISYVLGFVIIVLLIIYIILSLIKHTFTEKLQLIGPAVMGYSALLLVSVGRWGAYTIPSRYTTNGSWALGFFILICADAVVQYMTAPVSENRNNCLSVFLKLHDKVITPLNIMIGCGVSAAVIIANVSGFENVRQWNQDRKECQFLLANYSLIEGTSDFCTHVYPYVGTDDAEFSESKFRSMFAMMESKRWNVFGDDNTKVKCGETDLPDGKTNVKLTSTTISTEKLSAGSVSFRMNMLYITELPKRILRNSEYYVVLNGKTYYANYINDNVKFIRPIQNLNNGENSVQLYISHGSTLYFTDLLNFYYSNNQIVEVTDSKIDRSTLDDYSVGNQAYNVTLNKFNGGEIKTENIVFANDLISVTGSVNGQLSSDNSIYLSVGNDMWKLNITDYSNGNFAGTYVFDNEVLSNDIAIVVADDSQRIYQDFTQPYKVVIYPELTYVDLSEGTYGIIDPNGQVFLAQNGTNCQLALVELCDVHTYKNIYVDNSYCQIVNTITGDVLDVQDGSAESGANLQLYPYGGTQNQLWRYAEAGDGLYYIRSSLGTFVSYDDSGNAIMSAFDPQASIKWEIKQIAD